MTREELIQTPEYWQTLYENECERLGVKPILTVVKPIGLSELIEFAKKEYPPSITKISDGYYADLNEIARESFKHGYVKALIK